MKKKTHCNLTSYEAHLEEQYGKRGTATRENYEQGFEAFKLGFLSRNCAKQQNMMPEQLKFKI